VNRRSAAPNAPAVGSRSRHDRGRCKGNPSNFILLEKLIKVVHERAPQAKLCFNQLPSDIAEAVKRWI
jgi:hypothetical protein